LLTRVLSYIQFLKADPELTKPRGVVQRLFLGDGVVDANKDNEHIIHVVTLAHSLLMLAVSIACLSLLSRNVLFKRSQYNLLLFISVSATVTYIVVLAILVILSTKMFSADPGVAVATFFHTLNKISDGLESFIFSLAMNVIMIGGLIFLNFLSAMVADYIDRLEALRLRSDMNELELSQVSEATRLQDEVAGRA